MTIILLSDPTYMIRAIPSNASDNVYCTLLAQSAVHGAMAGYTGYTSGLVNGRQTYIPFHVCFFPLTFMVYSKSSMVALSSTNTHMVTMFILLFICNLQTWHLRISVVGEKNVNHVRSLKKKYFVAE